jgi:integrase
LKNDADSKNAWTKIKRQIGLYRYEPTGHYFARVRHAGKLHRSKLGTTDCELAKRKLADFKRDLERTDHSKGNMSLAAVLDAYDATLTGSASTLADKRVILGKVKQTLFGATTLPLRMMKPSQIEAWLAKHYGDKSASYYNSALTLVRSALDMAVRDRIITENPASALKYRKRKQPIRDTPSFEQFQQIVSNIRKQKFNRDAEQSADFVEFLGLAGLGQAEAASIKRKDVDLEAARIICYRHKMDVGFAIPIYPQLRLLVERLCAGKANDECLFSISEARKALANACRRLGFPNFTHRSLRRMFITRAIELGVDVKVVADWQGHRDGGMLILRTYSHVRPQHSQRMAQLMTSEHPTNVVPIQNAALEVRGA